MKNLTRITHALLLLLVSVSLHAQLGGGLFSPESYKARTVLFANLSTPLDGNFRYCSDCTATVPCAGSGTGAFATRINGAWTCAAGSGVPTYPLLAASDTAAAPGYSWAADPDTGLFNETANTIGFSTGGTVRGAFNSSGLRVGATTGARAVYGTGIVQFIAAGGDNNKLSYTDAVGPTWYDDNVAFTLTHNVQALTANRTITWPNVAGTVTTGTGTTGTIPKYTTGGSAVIGDSSIVESATNIGINGAASGTAGQHLLISDNGDLNNIAIVSNTNAAGTSALAQLRATGDSALALVTAHGSGRTATRFSLTLGGSGEFACSGGLNCIFGSITSGVPTYIGAGSVAGAKLNGTTAVISIPTQALTAGTMTATNPAELRTVVSRYDWTNAMVVALGATTAGDVLVCTLPAKTVVRNAYIVIDTPDTSSNALTVALGRTSAAYIDYIVASDAKGSANTVYGDASGERGTNLTMYDLPSVTGTTAVNAHFIKTTTNLSTVTGSTGHIYLVTEILP